jgi:hypothetical protein
MSKAIEQNHYRQWVDGEHISRKPHDMTNEELVRFTGMGTVVIIQRLKTLQPYLMELRSRFQNLKREEKICGFSSWNEYCTKHLGRTKRALNYMLTGGNKSRPLLPPTKPSGDAEQDFLDPAPKPIPIWQDIETGLQLLAEASRLLGLPTTDTLKNELKRIIRAAIEVLTEAITKSGINRDT